MHEGEQCHSTAEVPSRKSADVAVRLTRGGTGTSAESWVGVAPMTMIRR
jgi:hypothetical protein